MRSDKQIAKQLAKELAKKLAEGKARGFVDEVVTADEWEADRISFIASDRNIDY